MKLFQALVIFSLATSSVSFAQRISENAIGITYRTEEDIFPGAYFMYLFQDFEQTDNTTICFDYVAPNIIFTLMSVDDGSEWYLVQAGQDFTSAGIAADLYPPFAGTPDLTYGHAVSLVSSTFYLGVRTGSFETLGNLDRVVYGWAEFEVVDDVVYLVRSAVAYNVSGITVGTLNAFSVPEPTAYVALLGGGMLMVAMLGRFRRRRA